MKYDKTNPYLPIETQNGYYLGFNKREKMALELCKSLIEAKFYKEICPKLAVEMADEIFEELNKNE